MKKKSILACSRMLVVLYAFCIFGLSASANDMQTAAKVTTYEEHVANLTPIESFKNRPIEPIPDELYEVDSRGGTRIELENYDFGTPGTQFDLSSIAMEYNEIAGRGYYRVCLPTGAGDKYCRSGRFEVKPNRNYMASVLIWSDFSRYTNRTREFNLNLLFTDENGKYALNRRCGVPGDTEGWTRIEFVMSPWILENAKYCQANLVTTGFVEGMPESNILIADYQVYELPEKELIPYKEGEGVTFRGSAGSLDMAIEGVTTTSDEIRVDTTGAGYTFDLVNNTITAEQKINMERKVSTWKSDLSFKDLKVRSHTETEAVLSNSLVTFGVQMDGSLFLTPHQSDINLICTSEIGGHWNRYGCGHLIAFDDYGGFNVTPDIPEGTGRICRSEPITENLDFVNIKFDNEIKEDRNAKRNWFISSEKPGWQFKWTISPGERLCIGTFPPREYDWEAAFNSSYRNIFPAQTHLDNMTRYVEELDLDILMLWDFCHNTTAGMQYSPYYKHDVTEGITKEAIKAAHNNDAKAITYTTMHFYFDRSSPDRYINEVRRLRDRYGVDGVYSDGTPGEGAWVVAYEESRMLRELFPDGILIVHQTGQPGNGGAPLSSSAFFLPNMDAYYTATLKGESVKVDGFASPLANMTWPQYGLANCVGISKGDAWAYYDSNGNLQKINLTDVGLITVINGGMPRMDDGEENWTKYYLPVKNALEENWKTYGNEDNYYEKYYAPLARKLTKDRLSYIGYVPVIDDNFDTDDISDEYEMTNINSQPVTHGDDSAVKLRNNPMLFEGSLFKRSMSLSGSVSVEFDIKVDEPGNYVYSMYDDYGSDGIGLQISADNKLKIRNTDGGYATLCNLSRNTWHNIKLEVDTDNHLLTITADGAKLITRMKISEDFFYISNHEFSFQGYGSAFCLDNFKVGYTY
ncbi:MAG: hypothetical protein J6D26_02035 [Clostridia bacterium]|nr:hypothetical protein [Clostridia bacterium]